MKKIFNSIFWIVLFGLLSCEKVNLNIKSYLDFFVSNKYYSVEIIPTDYQNIYGKWKLFRISGGYGGGGYEPDFNYLEIKRMGIYGLVRNDSLLAYGKIELDTFDSKTIDFLQVKLIPDFYKDLIPFMVPQEKYIYLRQIDTLILFPPGSDPFEYEFKRTK